MSDDQSHKGFFNGRGVKATYTLDEADSREVQKNAREMKQQVKRTTVLSEAVQNALINRASVGGGDSVMRVTFDEWQRMQGDPEVETFAQYAHKLTHYSDGRERAQPLRPLLQNELGMYRGKIVVATNNPGDGKFTGTMLGVTTPETYKREREARERNAEVDMLLTSSPEAMDKSLEQPAEAQPDPFPSPKMTLITDDEE